MARHHNINGNFSNDNVFQRGNIGQRHGNGDNRPARGKKRSPGSSIGGQRRGRNHPNRAALHAHNTDGRRRNGPHRRSGNHSPRRRHGNHVLPSHHGGYFAPPVVSGQGMQPQRNRADPFPVASGALPAHSNTHNYGARSQNRANNQVAGQPGPNPTMIPNPSDFESFTEFLAAITSTIPDFNALFQVPNAEILLASVYPASSNIDADGDVSMHAYNCHCCAHRPMANDAIHALTWTHLIWSRLWSEPAARKMLGKAINRGVAQWCDRRARDERRARCVLLDEELDQLERLYRERLAIRQRMGRSRSNHGNNHPWFVEAGLSDEEEEEENYSDADGDDEMVL